MLLRRGRAPISTPGISFCRITFTYTYTTAVFQQPVPPGSQCSASASLYIYCTSRSEPVFLWDFTLFEVRSRRSVRNCGEFAPCLMRSRDVYPMIEKERSTCTCRDLSLWEIIVLCVFLNSIQRFNFEVRFWCIQTVSCILWLFGVFQHFQPPEMSKQSILYSLFVRILGICLPRSAPSHSQSNRRVFLDHEQNLKTYIPGPLHTSYTTAHAKEHIQTNQWTGKELPTNPPHPRFRKSLDSWEGCLWRAGFANGFDRHRTFILAYDRDENRVSLNMTTEVDSGNIRGREVTDLLAVPGILRQLLVHAYHLAAVLTNLLYLKGKHNQLCISS
ncbi:hypothetical protein F5880DRAFT_429213 [Lentinula raphanica]|nr:hypothetical protein F5880DRAFT_429213 [Lentinula raphanica]